MTVTEICGRLYINCDTAGRAVFTYVSKEHSASFFIVKAEVAVPAKVP
jgi:hypothetical protein